MTPQHRHHTHSSHTHLTDAHRHDHDSSRLPADRARIPHPWERAATARHTRSLAIDSAQGPVQRAHEQAIPSESAHARHMCRNRPKKRAAARVETRSGLPPQKKPAGGPLATSGKRGFRCVGHAHHGPLRSSGPAQHAPSPMQRTSRCRVAHAGGATRADRSRLAAARAPRVQHARATKVALLPVPPSARPIRP